MTTDFGSPAMHTTPSGEDRHTDLGRAAEDPPAGGSSTGRRRALRAWLDTTAWWTEPRPPITVLLEHAREGEWTLRQWQRHGRWCWVQTAARLGRLLPWVAGRVVAGSWPRPWGELPAVRATAGDTGTPWWSRALYVTTNWLSWVADGATRTALLAGAGWLCANWANNVPAIHWLVPDVVTAAYWWQLLAALWTGVFAEPAPPVTPAPTPAPPATPVAGPSTGSATGQLVFVAIVLGIVGWVKWRNRNKNAPGPEWGAGSQS